MAKFQMVGSENPNTIANVLSEVDIESFRKDQNWYEIKEVSVEQQKQPINEKEEVKVAATRKNRSIKKEI